MMLQMNSEKRQRSEGTVPAQDFGKTSRLWLEMIFTLFSLSGFLMLNLFCVGTSVMACWLNYLLPILKSLMCLLDHYYRVFYLLRLINSCAFNQLLYLKFKCINDSQK